MPDNRFFKPSQEMTLQQLAEIGACQLSSQADPELVVKNVASLENGQEDEIAFFENLKNAKMLAAFQKSKVRACIVRTDFNLSKPDNMVLLFSDNPHLSFVKIAQAFYPLFVQAESSPHAQIHETAQIGNNCQIAGGAVIAQGVVLGDNCQIGANTVIESHVVLGRDSIVFSNVTISHALIGERVIIYPGVRIGQDGFGYIMGEQEHIKIPQLGRVIIGDDVEIGANTTIDRGALDDTIIGAGCKIDNLVQIAHNVQLGKGCVIAGQAGISGSTKLGNLVVIGGQAGLAGHLKIGDGVRIAAQSGIMRELEPKETVMGTPAFPIKEYMRQIAYLQKAIRKK